MANHIKFPCDFVSLCGRMNTTVLFIRNVPDSNPGPKSGGSNLTFRLPFSANQNKRQDSNSKYPATSSTNIVFLMIIRH
jgi:hypothetical protein